ncbi:MBL fold metallo-hydrolase [Numidum massiliense]|uniref:MBL fold metallo-hydrolase n=1 Tax=Numidum massiliense TaxID=1522315 RepID=UPI000B052818|nr:MBL fold metallo-hydrolase [Numidum massiliense]
MEQQSNRQAVNTNRLAKMDKNSNREKGTNRNNAVNTRKHTTGQTVPRNADHKGQPQALGHDTYLIDGFDLGMPGRTGTYVIQGEQLTLIETGPSPSIPYVLDGLHTLGIHPHEVTYIVVTHIHLDHSGGAGVLLKHCPNATVVVHPRGARHLADPARLIKSARSVYGDQFDALFAPIEPIPAERLLVKEDMETLPIGRDCKLQFLHTPGHAKHHFSIFDPLRKTVYTGDTAGIRYHQTRDCGLTFYLPTTSPNQFDPEAMQASLAKIRALNSETICFGHYGATKDVNEALDEVSAWIPRFVEAGEDALASGESVDGITVRLSQLVSDYLNAARIPSDHPVYDILTLDFAVCAMGIALYLQK